MAEVEFRTAMRGTMQGGEDLSGIRATVGEVIDGTTNNPYVTPFTLNQAIGAVGAPHFASTADGLLAQSAVQEIIAGTNVTVDNTDPQRPIVSATGSGGGGVASVVAGDGIAVDNTDPDNPVVSNVGLIDITAGSGIAINKTDPRNPVITATGGGGGGGTIDTIVAGTNITVDATDPVNPTVSAPPFGTTSGTIAEGDDSRITGALQGSNNLSDVANSTTAFGNIKQSASTTATGVVELATVSEVHTAEGTGDKAVTSELIADASAIVTLTDSSTVSVDWATFINADVTLTASRTLANPTNVVPGTFRTIIFKGNDATSRVISFSSNYKGTIPTDGVTNASYLMVNLYAYTATHIVVTSCKAL